jgi:hypothetical protein
MCDGPPASQIMMHAVARGGGPACAAAHARPRQKSSSDSPMPPSTPSLRKARRDAAAENGHKDPVLIARSLPLRSMVKCELA